jgi:hypothetical protein
VGHPKRGENRNKKIQDRKEKLVERKLEFGSEREPVEGSGKEYCEWRER